MLNHPIIVEGWDILYTTLTNPHILLIQQINNNAEVDIFVLQRYMSVTYVNIVVD